MNTFVVLVKEFPLEPTFPLTIPRDFRTKIVSQAPRPPMVTYGDVARSLLKPCMCGAVGVGMNRQCTMLAACNAGGMVLVGNAAERDTL